ncbi:MAG: glycine cleavage system aminomethyltransferase GcvT [Gemmatimonadaceae bacterium]|nr:glycine cleavage system aminomethyltransferase GcvT [Gemmatimonadaceae bacterium]
MSAPESLQRTALYDTHVALGAKIVPFAGFEMPVQYPGGITVEHHAVRKGCGLFDVSHMGEFLVTGPGAIDFVNHVTTNDVSKLAIGQAHYSTFCNERGTIEDDCLVYRFEDHLMLVVNASNIAKDWAHIEPHLSAFDATLEDVSAATALLALQGPNAPTILARHTGADLDAIRYYHFAVGTVAGIDNVIISRTGYTGEDGFELYFPDVHAPAMWAALMSGGDVTPAGLGARDTLRLEMGMALYGNDIDDTVTPYEANLAWLVKLTAKERFVGREALVAQKMAGIPRKLVGFTMPVRNVPRHGMPVFIDGEPSGVVCSGTVGPSVGIPIGTCYLPAGHAKVGTTFEVEIRGTMVTATVAALPFWTSGSARK